MCRASTALFAGRPLQRQEPASTVTSTFMGLLFLTLSKVDNGARFTGTCSKPAIDSKHRDADIPNLRGKHFTLAHDQLAFGRWR